jgi:hypothetical protein
MWNSIDEEMLNVLGFEWVMISSNYHRHHHHHHAMSVSAEERG